MMFGILNINKPKGFTSHDVVAKLRKILNFKKIGHTGTLDPIATGVLPICVGNATKLIQYLDDGKAYRAYIKLGIKTDTYDTEGNILETNSVKFDKRQVENFLKDFQGNIKQVPPMYSAVHYKGKRLYEYARKGIEVEEIPTRDVTVNSINLVGVEDEISQNPTIIVDVDCSAGTYIRSIIHDLGEKLGYGATMIGLIRTKAGKFVLKKSYTLEDVQKIVLENRQDEIFYNPCEFINLEAVTINDFEVDKIKHGQYINSKFDEENKMIQLLYANKLVGLGEVRRLNEHYKIFPKNVFIKD